MSTLKRSTRPFAFALAALLALLPLATPPSRAQTFSEGISVMAVEIPVQVLRNGRPVRGLTAADFEVLDRGQPQEIVAFEVIDLTRIESAERAVEPRAAAAPAAEAPTRGRQLLLLFDLDFLAVEDQFDMARALHGARRMVRDQLHPLDRAAIGLYTGNGGAQLLVGFTRERERSQKALDFIDALLDRNRKRAAGILAELQPEADGDPGAFVARLTRQFGSSAGLVLSASDLPTASLQGYNDLLAGGGPGPGDEGASDGLIGAITDMSDAALEPGLDRISNLADSLGELATLLRGVPEPKHLVWFSRSFPNAWIETPELRARAQNRLQPLVETMRASGWRVQAVDTAGVPDALGSTGRTVTADVDPGGQRALAGSGRFDLPPSGVGFESQTLFQLSHDTGGQLFENYNDFGRATADLIERSAVTYLLVIQPTVPGGGEYHPLEVRLEASAPNARVLHRPGYFEPRPAAERGELERRLDDAELLFGERRIADLNVAVLAYPTPPGAGRAAPLLFEIDGPALLAGGGESAQLLIEAYVMNDDDSVHDVLSQRLDLDLERLGTKLSEAPLRFLGAVGLPEGERRLRVRVRHQPSGKEFLSTITIDPPGDRPAVLPPLLLHPSEFAPLSLQAPAAAEAARAFKFGDVTVLPDPAPRLRRGETRHVLLTLYELGDRSPALSYRLRNANGEEVAADLAWQQRADGEGGEVRLIGLLGTTELATGEYRLEVELRDGTGDRTSVASSRFEVVGGA